ncbi:MAG: hypothetical protein L3K17_00655 [Thermoplasmata archaeon]|nr:hypothetical protein [Thermoplasmata archaeon]
MGSLGPALVRSPSPPTAAPITRPENPASAIARLTAFLRRHPVVCLLLLTPGIPEYLSGSSSIDLIVASPIVFLLFLAANLGLYGPGALLIREVMVRRGKGWPTLLLLGAAYGILEEGIALSTLFNPHASVVGSLGFYGHFLGVSWVWALGVLMVHVVFSISLPILLLGLAIPATRGKPLLTERQIVITASLLLLDVTVLAFAILRGAHFWMGDAVFVGAIATIALLVYAGVRVGMPSWPRPGTRPSWTPTRFLLLGLALFPGTILVEGFLGYWRFPAAGTFVVLGGYYVAWVWMMLSHIGSQGSERSFVMLTAGLLAPIMAIGVLGGLPVPLVLVADLLAFLLLRKLWRAYPSAPLRAPVIPWGATAG